jgi:AraC-like DNA-binding protein
MNHTLTSTGRVHAAERAETWGLINAQYFGRLRVANLDEGPLDASIDAYEVGQLRMYRIEAPAHHVVRDAACGELPSDDFYKLVLQVAGQGVVEQQQRRVVLDPGHWILYDPRIPYSITNPKRCSLLVTQVPRSALAGLRLPVPHAGEMGTHNIAGLHGVFGSYLQALSEQLQKLPDGVGHTVSESVVGLLASTLAESLQRSGAPMPLPSVMKMRVRQYVQTHVADPDLSIQRIAEALRCSKRYLHRVFEDDECGLERHIWAARLDRCRSALADQTNEGRSVADIAFDWGFKSSAHFCRLFKQEYGVTPRAFQLQAAQERHRSMAH